MTSQVSKVIFTLDLILCHPMNQCVASTPRTSQSDSRKSAPERDTIVETTLVYMLHKFCHYSFLHHCYISDAGRHLVNQHIISRLHDSHVTIKLLKKEDGQVIKDNIRLLPNGKLWVGPPQPNIILGVYEVRRRDQNAWTVQAHALWGQQAGTIVDYTVVKKGNTYVVATEVLRGRN